jgi:hypothetical protein
MLPTEYGHSIYSTKFREYGLDRSSEATLIISTRRYFTMAIFM